MPDFLPRRDAALLVWSDNYVSLLAASPEAFAITPSDADELVSLHAAFASAYALSQSPKTRTSSTLRDKDNALHALKRKLRSTARIIQAAPGVTDVQRTQLGLKIRPTSPPRLAPPSRAPLIQVLSIAGRRIDLFLSDPASPSRRGKPRGVAGAVVMCYTGEEPPASLSQWKWACNTTVARFPLQFGPETPAGARVWLAAQWRNARGEAGPVSAPVPTHLGHAAPVFSRSLHLVA